MPDVGVRHQADLLEHLEVAVDRRQVHPGRGALHLGEDLLRRPVPQPLDGLEDKLALRRDAVAATPEPLLPLGGLGHGVTRLRRADRWLVSGCPTAAMSYVQSRSPSRRP